MCADNPPAPKPVVGEAATKRPPMVIQNPDGTITFQKMPPQVSAKGATTRTGLIIPPQVVVPFIPALKKKPRN
jgi:hypothetical protein